MTGHDTTNRETKMNATQTMILKDAAKIANRLRREATVESHRAAEALMIRAWKLIDAAA
jgi:hypothetical protein